MTEVALLSYGAGNIASVQFALERLGAQVRRVDAPEAVADAPRLILPGVGQAGFAMARLRELGLVEAIRAFDRPLLGGCLGQLLLFESSDEGGGVELLGLIPGRVQRLAPAPGLPVPHMGWSRLDLRRDDPLTAGLPAGSWAYFVHGYVCPAGPATVAAADYGGVIPAVVRSGSRAGCQFHPERSAAAGARILANFLELPA